MGWTIFTFNLIGSIFGGSRQKQIVINGNFLLVVSTDQLGARNFVSGVENFKVEPQSLVSGVEKFITEPEDSVVTPLFFWSRRGSWDAIPC